MALASRTTSKAEYMYSQLDLEAMGVDFGLRRFRYHLLGSPDETTVITDLDKDRKDKNASPRYSVPCGISEREAKSD